jgi:hypothetical protein
MSPKLYSAITPLLKNEFNAKETMELLTYGANRARYFCWGVTKKIGIYDKGLLLKVNARNHNGYVLITYDGGQDLYEMHILSIFGKVLKSFEQVYFDVLSELIDGEIEAKK